MLGLSRLRNLPPMRALSLGLLALGALLLLAFLVPLWFATPTRIVTISAETQKMKIVFLGTGQSWTMDGARLCEPGQVCAAAEVFSYGRIDWRPCDSVEIERSDAIGGVLVSPSFPVDGGETVTPLFLDDAQFRINGVQAFKGHVQVGEDVQSGRSSQLLWGDYTFYERDALSWILRRWNPDDVQSGTLRHGDQLSVIRRPGPLASLNPFDYSEAQAVGADCPLDEGRLPSPWNRQEVFGHVALPLSPEENPGLLATLTSASGNVAVQVLRRGFREPLILRPDWIDVVIASPAFLAVTAILTYLASILQAFAPSGKQKGHQEDS